MRTLPARQRGVALLIALLAVALAVILIASLLDRGELAFARTRNALRGQQAIAYAEGLEAFAAQTLIRDLDSGTIDTHADMWAMPLPPQEVPGGRISAQMRDLNGCFNLNNLADPLQGALWRQRLRSLLQTLRLDPSLVGSISDWIDADFDVDDEGGAEDSVYLAQRPPYRAANRPLVHLSELRLVRGVSAEVYARLAPEVCVLPAPTAINVNTASAAVLMSLSPQLTAVLAERIRQDGQAQWGSIDEALREAQNQGVEVSDRTGLGVTSDHFLARAEIELDGIPFTWSSVLQRRMGVRVILRSRAADDAAVAVPGASPSR